MAYRISGKAGGSESEQKTAEAEQPELQARSLASASCLVCYCCSLTTRFCVLHSARMKPKPVYLKLFEEPTLFISNSSQTDTFLNYDKNKLLGK